MFTRCLRYASALLLLIYGFAKLNGSQFTILDSQLDRPMGQVSGFWLTWYYFGYSHIYSSVLAGVEIVGALLLTFRRTTLLAACVLAPVLSNIVIIDLCYGVDLGATVAAILLLTAMLILLKPHAKELLSFFLGRTPEAESLPAQGARWAARTLMVALAFGATYWLANVNNRNPTPLDGVWDVVRVDPLHAFPDFPKTVFFELNRAGWVTFKTADGSYRDHDFEVDAVNHRLKISETWLTKGQRLFDGAYVLAGSDLTLTGDWRNQGASSIGLHKRAW